IFRDLVLSRPFFLRIAVVVAAAGLGCYALARYLAAPVRKIQDAARRMAAGDLGVRLGEPLTGSHDELGQLARDFDRMAERLQALRASERQLFQDVSHELRSPLARLNVAVELAGRDAGPEASRNLARIAHEAERLNDLIGQLLTLARLEGGTVENTSGPVDLQALVREVAADADFEAAASGRRVRVVRCDACVTAGSAALLRSALENVVRNALHHTAEGTEVEVMLAADGGEVVAGAGAGGVANSPRAGGAAMLVRDHGPGVPAESLERIFQPFFRVAAANERKPDGTGLGLAITERAIRLHGGRVSAFNAEGGGLAVRIELPISGPVSGHVRQALGAVAETGRA
ncbi:MAG: HAMP domain-containing protein, partial [Gemmataceae bacterium]|nr:HAMP domain-containing protein [Gemmataceae bacterium]